MSSDDEAPGRDSSCKIFLCCVCDRQYLTFDFTNLCKRRVCLPSFKKPKDASSARSITLLGFRVRMPRRSHLWSWCHLAFVIRHKGAPVNAVHLLRLRSIVGCKPPQRAATLPDLGSALDQWLEGELLRHCASAYCNNVPPLPRSTIALAFSPDGRLLASTQ